MKSPHDISDFDILLDPSLNEQDEEERDAIVRTLLGELETLLDKLFHLSLEPFDSEQHRQASYVLAFHRLVHGYKGLKPVEKSLDRLIVDLLGNSNRDRRNRFYEWELKSRALLALRFLEHIKPTKREARKALLEYESVRKLIQKYETRGETSDQSDAVRKWKQKFRDGTGFPLLNRGHEERLKIIEARLPTLNHAEAEAEVKRLIDEMEP